MTLQFERLQPISNEFTVWKTLVTWVRARNEGRKL